MIKTGGPQFFYKGRSRLGKIFKATLKFKGHILASGDEIPVCIMFFLLNQNVNLEIRAHHVYVSTTINAIKFNKCSSTLNRKLGATTI